MSFTYNPCRRLITGKPQDAITCTKKSCCSSIISVDRLKTSAYIPGTSDNLRSSWTHRLHRRFQRLRLSSGRRHALRSDKQLLILRQREANLIVQVAPQMASDCITLWYPSRVSKRTVTLRSVLLHQNHWNHGRIRSLAVPYPHFPIHRLIRGMQPSTQVLQCRSHH